MQFVVNYCQKISRRINLPQHLIRNLTAIKHLKNLFSYLFIVTFDENIITKPNIHTSNPEAIQLFHSHS